MRIVENLAQKRRADQNSTMFRHGDRLASNTNSPSAFDNKIKFFHLGMPMQRVGALRRETPKPGTKISLFVRFKKIRIGNFHDVRRPP
jgi:hypothetical protein